MNRADAEALVVRVAAEKRVHTDSRCAFEDPSPYSGPGCEECTWPLPGHRAYRRFKLWSWLARVLQRAARWAGAMADDARREAHDDLLTFCQELNDA